MRVQIGPVTQGSAVAWLDYAAGAVDDLAQIADPRLDGAALDAFRELLAAWRATVEPRHGGPFLWIGEEDPDRVEFLIQSLYRAGLAVEHAANLGQARLRPPEADEFHMVLVGEVLALLHAEGPAHAQFVESLREEWDVASRQL